MRKSNPTTSTILWGAAIAVGAWLLLKPKKREPKRGRVGPPTAEDWKVGPPPIEPHMLIYGLPLSDEVVLHKTSLGSYYTSERQQYAAFVEKNKKEGLSAEAATGWAKLFYDRFADRRARFLPADATGAGDKYSKQHLTFLAPGGKYVQPKVVDEWGRAGIGTGFNILDSALSVAQVALPWIPGVGPFAAYGLAVAIDVGRGKSLKDAMIQNAEQLVPIQYRWAYHLAVGIASGEPVDEAAVEAALEYGGPEAKLAYQQGKEVYEKYVKQQ